MSKSKQKYNQNESEDTMGSNLTNLSNTSVSYSSSVSSDVTSSAITSSATVKPETVIKSNVNVTTTKTPVVTKTESNPNVVKLDNLISDYEAAVKASRIKDDGKFESMNVLISICEYLNKNTDPAVFEAFFRYFQRNQNDLMHYETALRGIHMIQNKMVKTRVSATHACYLELCRVRSLKKATYKFTINAMRVMCISETQGKWIIEKSTNRQ